MVEILAQTGLRKQSRYWSFRSLAWHPLECVLVEHKLLARVGFNESVWTHLWLLTWVSLGFRSCQTLQSASFRAFVINYKISHWIKYINNPIWLKVKVMEWINTKNLIKNTHHSVNFQEENIYKMRLF